jgi:hypothetical protein
VSLTPCDLRGICESLNDERGTGGQTRLARLVGWNFSTLWRKLNGKSLITQSDELAIRQTVRFPAEVPRDRPVGGKMAEKRICTFCSNRRK